jgi:hypothetical protein
VVAIPDTGGATYAPRGVMRALLRVVVLGGLVIAGWLLGSGISHADEHLGLPTTGVVQRWNPAPSDDGSGGQFGMPPIVVPPTPTRMLSTVSVQLPLALTPVTAGVLKPIANGVTAPKPLAKALAQISRPISVMQHATPIRSQAPGYQPATAPPAPSVRAVPARAPALAPLPSTVLTTLAHAQPTAPVFTIAAAPAESFAGQSTLSALPGQGNPASPIPANLPETTTAPCMIGGASGGAGTKSAPDFAVNDNWTAARLAPMHHLLHLNASDLPRSPATQPSTSPD